MPENTDTKSTVSAESANEFKTLQGVQAQSTDPTDPKKEDARYSYVNTLKVLMPEYAYWDKNYLLHQLRSSEQLQERLVSTLVEENLKSDKTFRSWWESDDTKDEDRSAFQSNLRKKIQKDITKHVYDGQSVKDSVISHQLKLSKKTSKYGISNPESVVSKFPDNYSKYFDKEDIDKGVDESLVQSLYENNDDFREQLIRDRVSLFDQQLDTSANQGVINPTDNPTEYAKAFSIYNKFGKEGLTDYMNILQHYIPGADIQDNRVVSAFRKFKKSPLYKDNSPFRYAEQFITGNKALDLEPQDPLYKYQDVIQQAAEQHGIESSLLAGVIQHESVKAALATGKAPETIESHAGAIGMGQLTADTARDYGLTVNDSVDERKDPIKNIHTSAKILAEHMKTYEGDIDSVLAAYNAGPGGLQKMQMRAKEKGKSDFKNVIGEGFYSETAGYIPAVKEEVKRFNKDHTETIDELVFTPRQQIDKKPKDWNPFTAQNYYTPENKIANSHQERTVGYINNLLEAQGAPFDFSIGSKDTSTADKTSFTLELDQDKPLDLQQAFVYNKRQHGDLPVPNYDQFVYDVIASALTGRDDAPSFEGMITTLAANANDFHETDRGTYVYQLDYKELEKPENQYLKILVDGLKIHKSIGSTVMSIVGDKVLIEPDKQKRRNIERANMTLSDFMGGISKLAPISNALFGDTQLFQKEKQLVVDEGNNIIGFEEKVPNNLENVVAGAVIGFTDIVPEAYGGIVGGWGGTLARYFQADEDFIEDLDQIRHKQRDYYSGTLEEFADPVIGNFSAPDIGIAGGTLLGYLAGTKALGKGLAKLGSKAVGKGALNIDELNHLAAIRKTDNFKNFYKLVTGGSKSGAKRALENTFKAIGKKHSYSIPAEFTLGAAGIETFTDPNFSMATFADLIIQDQILGLRNEDKWNVDRMYRTSGAVGRWATDFLGGEMLGILFDGMMGVGKFANDYTFRAMTGRPKLGLEFDASTGKYKPEGESKYFQESGNKIVTGARKYLFPDIQRFVFNIRNNVDNIPLGDIAESATKYARMVSPGAQYYGEGTPKNVDVNKLKETKEALKRELDEEIGKEFREGTGRFSGEDRNNVRKLHDEISRVNKEIREIDKELEGVSSQPTQSDIAAKFISDSNEFMGTFRDDLRSIIENVNERYGGSAKLSTDQIDNQVNQIYDEFLDQTARQINEFVGDGDFNTTSFAQMLEQHPVVSKDITAMEFQGKSELTRTEATILQKQFPNSYGIELPNGKYKVYQQDPALWRFDLANRLRQYDGSVDSFNRSVDNHLRKFGLDVKNQEDVDDAGRVIETLRDSYGIGLRQGEREGVVKGFNRDGWNVQWDDGSEAVYREIRGLDELPESPPDIRIRGDEGEETVSRGTGRFDEQGLEIEEEIASSQKSKGKILDLRSTRQILDESRERNIPALEQRIDNAFEDPDQAIQSRLDKIKTAVKEGRHDEAEELIREISAIKSGGGSDEVIELPGIQSLRGIVESDREAFQAARAARQPTELDMVMDYHKERLQASLTGGNLDTATADINMLRSMGMSKQDIDDFINANFAGDTRAATFLKQYNTQLDFGEGTIDELMRARVNSKVLAQIKDEALQRLPKQIKEQMAKNADLFVSRFDVDTPQKMINEGDPEAISFRSWEQANERFKEYRPKRKGMTGRQYSQSLAEDLGVGTMMDIAKLQKTRSGASEKIPITSFDQKSILNEKGQVQKIKNSDGLVVRVDPVDGGLPMYAIGRKNNIKGFPTRFISDQNGKISVNQEWAFINPNVTQRVDGRLRRFNTVSLASGEIVYKEHPDGKWVLNVQNPERVDFYEYVGRNLKDTAGNNHIIKGTPAEKILSPRKVLAKNVDAIETTEPYTGNKIYRLVDPESQALKYQGEVSSPGDRRTPHVLFQTENRPLSPMERLKEFSQDGPGIHAHAWLAIPGLTFTGVAGFDEDGNLTPFAKAALALGALTMGGVLIRSMTGKFKIRKAYDRLDAKYQKVFDQFNWAVKTELDGTPIQKKLTDDESAMFNRLQGVPKEDYKVLAEITSNLEIQSRKNIISGTKKASDEIPKIEAEVTEFPNRDFLNWSTEFTRDGKISYRRNFSNKEPEFFETILNPDRTKLEDDGFFMVDKDFPEGTRREVFPSEDGYLRTKANIKNQIPLNQQPVISLELKPDSEGLVTNTRPAHTFMDEAEASRISEEVQGVFNQRNATTALEHRPIAWSRLNKAPDGRILLDELQVDNALQKGRFGQVGDVNRDLYTAVLDEVVDKALKESDGEFYITRGHMQTARYGENPEDEMLRSQGRKRIFEVAKRKKEELGEYKTSFVAADELVERVKREHYDMVGSLLEEGRTGTARVNEGDYFIPKLGKMTNEYLGEKYPGKVEEELVKGFRDELLQIAKREIPVEDSRYIDEHGNIQFPITDDYLLRSAAKDVWNADELIHNTFPRWQEFFDFTNEKSKYKGVQLFYDNELPNVIKKRYGADVQLAKGEPAGEYDSVDRAFHKVTVTKEGLDRARGKTGKRIDWEVVPGSLALVGLGATAYAMEGVSDQQPETNVPMNKAGIGNVTLALMGAAALGMMAHGRVHTKIGGFLKGKVKAKIKNSVDNIAEKTLEYDGKKFSARELYELDMSFNPNDPESIGRTLDLVRGAKRAASAGKKIGDWFKNSAYTQAGTQMLKGISERIKTATGSRRTTIADRISELILDANQAPSKIKRIASQIFNEDLEYGRGAFQSYHKGEGLETIRRLFDSDVDEANAQKLFNSASWRLLNRGIQVSGDRGVASSKIPKNVEMVYRSKNGDVLRKLDQDLLNDKKFVDYLTTYQKAYNEVRSQYLRHLKNEMTRRVFRFNKQTMDAEHYQIGDNVYSHDQLTSLVDKWVNGREVLTYSEYVKTLNPDQRHLFRVANKESIPFQDIVKVQKMRTRFTDLKNRYFPQMVDQDKVEAVRQRFVDFAVEEGMDDPENWARQQMIKEFRRVNEKGDGRGLVGFDKDRLDMRTQEFDNPHEAHNTLTNILNQTAPREFQDQFDEFVGTRRVTPEVLEDLGFIVKARNKAGAEVYTLRQPDNFNPTVGGGDYSIFDVANSMRFKDFYNTVMLEPAMRRSKFLENPRKFLLPSEWVIDDPNAAWNKYAVDTGYRLHALEYGLFDQKDFHNNYVNPLTSAMRNTGFDEDQIMNVETRTKEIFDNQWGIINEIAGMSPREVEQYMKKKRSTTAGMQTFRNLNYMKQAYGFKYLDWFQTLLSTQVMTSGRAMREAFGFGEDGLSYGGLQQFEDLLTDINVIKDKDLSFRFDQQALDPTGEHGSVSSWMQKASQTGADKVSDFSLEKWALNLIGVDVGSNGRAFRLVTDSFHGVNVMNTGQNAIAFTLEASHYARIAKKMQDAGIGVDGMFQAPDGKTYTWSEVYRKLENLGVSRTKDVIAKNPDGSTSTMKEVDYFIREENQLKDFIGRLKNNERVSLNDFDPKYADMVERMWHFATESYHGTNKAMRPEKWNSQLGRTLSMYASFTFNLGMQVTKRRILDPMNTWISRYATDADGNQQIGKMQLALLMKHIRSGNEQALIDAGITDVKRAIAEFPIDAISTAQRALAGVGFGVATYTTLDIMRDIYAYPVNAALGEEQFQRTKEAFSGVINPYDAEEKQVTFQELFGGEGDAKDMMKLLTWTAGKFAQSSYGGMYLSPFESMTKYGFRGTANLIPTVGIGDRFITDVMSLAKPVGTLNFDELPPEMLKFGINNLPVISSNVFTESRESARDKINEYIKSLEE